MRACPVITLEGSNRFMGPRALAVDSARFSAEINALRDSIMMCTTCWECEEVCPARIDLPQAILDLRRMIFDQEVMLPGHRRIVENVDRFGRSVEPGPARPSDHLSRGADVAYFPGCISQERIGSIYDSTVGILGKVNSDFGVPQGWVCCGAPLEKVGDRKRMDALKERNLEVMEGFDLLVTSCPGCTTHIQNHYGIEPLHTIEYLREVVGLDNLHFRPSNMRVTLHHPCHLNRTIGPHAIDYAYEILQRVPDLEVVEMERADMCCGGGGGVVAGYPDVALDLAKEKTRYFEKSGACLLLAPCPFCVLNLERAGGGRVMEFITFIEGMLE